MKTDSDEIYIIIFPYMKYICHRCKATEASCFGPTGT
jgi:hypothetical protein